MMEVRSHLHAPRSLLLACALLLISCSSNSNRGGPTSIGFRDPDSDVIAILPALRADDATIVVMRGDSAERAKYVEFFYADGTWIEAVEDASARVIELNLPDQRFVFSEYSATRVTVTHHAPDGTSSSAQVAIGVEGEKVAGLTAALTDEEAAPHDDTELTVADALNWFRDPSNYQLHLNTFKKAGQAVEKKLSDAKQKIEDFTNRAEKLGTKLGNHVKCLTATRRLCAEQTAAHAAELVRELRMIDPNGATEAGFEVSSTGISPKYDEWASERARGTIPTEFTLTDVSCEESVFADMNPDCPQYVPPSTNGGAGGTGGSAAGGAGGTGSSGTSGSSGKGGAGGAAGAGGSAGGPAGTNCKASSSSPSHFQYKCAEYTEVYEENSSGTGYSRYHPTNGVLQDLLGIGITAGAVVGYSIHDYEYDANRQRVREEFIYVSTPNDYHERYVVTPVSADEYTKETVQCDGMKVKRTAFRHNVNPAIMGTRIYEMNDSDTSKCPTIDDVKTLARKVFPEVEMSLGYVQSTTVYKNYTAAH